MKKLSNAQTKLEKAVQVQVNRLAANYDDGVEGFIKDLMYGGCASGLVGSMIYYTDTIKFYKRHANEIDAMLKESMSECGIKSPAELFGDKWDNDDPLARDTQNQNLLAWYGFEETARNLASQAGIDC